MAWLSGPNPIGFDLSGMPTAPDLNLSPFQHGSHLYCLVKRTGSSYDLYKATTLDGVTWTQITSWTGINSSAVSVDVVGDTLYFGYLKNIGGTRAFVDVWNLNTDTFVATLDSAATFSSFGPVLVKGAADGTVVLYIRLPDGLYISRWDGALWSAAQLVDGAGGTGVAIAITSDAASNVYLYYWLVAGYPNVTYYMKPLSSANVLGTRTAIATSATSNVGKYGMIAGLTSTEHWIALWTAGVFRSQSLSAPVWINSASGVNHAAVNLAADPVTNAVWVIHPDQVIPTKDQIAVKQYLGSNTWGPSIVGIDFLLNPPPPPVYSGTQFAHSESTRLLGDGTFGVALDFFQDPAVCATYYAHFNALSAPPLGVSCNDPPAGTVGVAY